MTTLTIEEHIEQLRAHARTLSTSQIAHSIRTFGGGALPPAETSVRAALLDLIAERSGLDAADLLMDEVGL